MIEDKIDLKVLNKFKPLLVVYYPYSYNMDKTRYYRLEALKAKLGTKFEEQYMVLFVPHVDESFKLDLLSVVKSKFLRDKDLKNYVKKLQDEILENEEKSVVQTEELKNMFK